MYFLNPTSPVVVLKCKYRNFARTNNNKNKNNNAETSSTSQLRQSQSFPLSLHLNTARNINQRA